MTWRLELLDFGGHPPSDQARAMGPRDRVRALVDDALADVEWSGGRGTLRDGDAEMEIDLGDAEPCLLVSLAIAGPHPKRMRSLVVHLCRVNGWAARDVESGRYLNLDADLDESLD